MSRKWMTLILLILGAMIASGCAISKQTMMEYNEAKELFYEATMAGGKDCAPFEYASAEAAIALANHEVAEKDPYSNNHLQTSIKIAKEQSLRALELSPCAPEAAAPVLAAQYPLQPVPPEPPKPEPPKEAAQYPLQPVPPRPPPVRACREAGLKTAVASSADLIKIVANLRKIGLPPESWDAIITGDDVEHKKPAPDIFLAAATKLQIAPECCVVVEDAVNGIEAAIAAGMRCVAVTQTFGADLLAGADAVRRSMADITLPDLVG